MSSLVPRVRAAVSASVAVVLLAGVLAACGGSSGGKVTLTFWTHTHPPMVALNKKLVAEYQKNHPNVTIRYQSIPNDDFNTKTLTAMSNGTGPDVLNMDDSAIRGDYIPKRLIAPVDPKALGVGSVAGLKARYNEGTLDGASDGKDLYGLPTEFNSTAFAINTKHFADAGLDPANPPKTWDDVSADAKKLVAAGHTQAFSWLYLHSGWYSQQLQTLLDQTGGRITDPDHRKATVDSPQALAALKIWVNLAAGPNRAADPNRTSREATAPFADLATGRQSMSIIYPWALAQIKESNPDVYQQLKVVPLPQVHPDSPVNRWYGYYLTVNRASKHQKEAWQFISYVTSQHARWLSDVNFIQPVTGWENSTEGKQVPFVDVWSSAYHDGRFDEVAPHFAEIQDALMTMVNDSVFNHVSPDKAADKAAGTINRSLGS